MQQKSKRGGISAKSLEIPIITVLFILHAVVIILILQISASTTRLSNIMRDSNRYSAEATELMSGVSILSETANGYIQNHSVSATVITYAKELRDHPERRGATVNDIFKDYDVPQEAKDALNIAADNADEMMTIQLHAIALTCYDSVSEMFVLEPNPDDPDSSAALGFLLTKLPVLTEAEKTMSGDARQGAARDLLFTGEYPGKRGVILNNISECNRIIRENADAESDAISRQVDIKRAFMWTCTITILIIFSANVWSIHFKMVRPLVRMAKTIPTGADLNEEHGLKEVRTVAGAYNEVHKRRDALDAILRSAAETDALTGVQNRYCYEQYLLELSESDCSGAVFLFDINFLKQTNDTKGHEAGDNLIRAVAECIVDCFGKDCFCLGGDEFAAIVKNCTHESVAEMIKRFESETKKRNVSVSFGWAYTYRIANTNLKFLMNEADQKMYEQKKRIHGNKGLL